MEKELTTVKLADGVMSLKGSIHPQAMLPTVAGLLGMFKVDIDNLEMKDFEVSFTLADDGTVEFIPSINKEDIPSFCLLISMLANFGTSTKTKDSND